MPNNDHGVFDEITGGSGQPSAIDYLAYALFAFERREWIAHTTNNNNGQPPTQADIDIWISNLTRYNFDQMRSRAAGTFDVAARAYMDDDIKEAKDETLRSAVVREVKAAGNFWRQLFIALVTAILAPVIIGLIVVAALRSDKIIPTVTDAKNAIEGQQTSGQAKPESSDKR